MTSEVRNSQWVLLVGLTILVLSILSTLAAIVKLEEAVDARRQGFEIQDRFDDLDKRIKDWAMIAYQATSSSSEKQERLDRVEMDVEGIFDDVYQNISGDSSQLAFLRTARSAWNEAKKVDPELGLAKIELIDRTLAAMDNVEKTKVTLHESVIIEYTRRLITFIFFSVIVALLMILFSLWAKSRQEKSRLRSIEELKKLREEAVSASNLKSKFLSTVSHEIRTPLNGIIGLSEILSHSPLSNEQQKFIQAVHQSGKTLLRIINDILDFSKIESGKLDLDLSEFSIVEVLDQILFTLSPKAAEKSIAISYEIDPFLPQWVKGDSGRLSQVLFNLIGNAIKFTSIGSVIVRVKREDRDHQSQIRVFFSVEDTGIGLSDEEKETLFVPFVQGKRTGTSGEEGTGLGLSISQHIVNAMGGTIKVSSELGRGSRFSFSVLFAQCSPEKIGSIPKFKNINRVNLDQKIESIFSESHRPSILVVEDNPTNQIVAQNMLSQLGGQSTLASDGREAVSLAKNSKFDLILMDCQMPLMDGFEATRNIRILDQQTPIVAMTANASSQDEEKCLAAGMNDFLPKPISLFQVSKILQKYLPRYRIFSFSTLKDLENKIGKNSVNKVVSSYISTMSEFISLLENHVASANLEGLRLIGHRFRSSSLTVGASHLAELCQDLENLESINGMDRLKPDLLESIRLADLSLKSYLSGL